MVLDGPMTGRWFLADVEQILCPTLQAGDVVMMDNLPAHKSAAVRGSPEDCTVPWPRTEHYMR
ncbi:hypothetical protein ABAZ39_16540 (plasmid) [Azospirillum argentinense]|uniref:Tc1-like transposase DDE domain-containing protein n=1 Tax=Azospirillum argentinense TaxID=2970906 RepID=A0A2K1FRG6_9PROT|nr:hypothetical protein ABAZ39_16540 [Azospirillum argentinense]EZQ06130.1 transposase [Azospirillum argentinense]KAA1052899.1 Mobile element protein [Azospirillum argentinense]PNQ95120.1 hypothetical protein C1S70_30530 [Azospirillum argentinense]